jgi:Helix-turn-helix domain
MPTISRAPLSGRYLSFAEREELAILRAQEVGVRETARQLGRSASTISRELGRNAATRGGRLEYRATTAQWHADRRAERPKVAKLAANQRLRSYVQQRLAGEIRRPNGIAVSGPEVRWIGRRHGRRKDRRWAHSWSPEQITNRLRVDFPDMGPCGSPTRPSTRRCTSKVAAPCAVSRPPVCGRGGRCGCPGRAPKGRARRSSARRS